jgi:hypothetical protein
MRSRKDYISNIDLIVIGFIFLILLVLPLIFTRENGRLAWSSILKIWQDKVLLIPLFAINHWLLVPKLVLKKQYAFYLITVLTLITLVTAGYYFHDEKLRKEPPPVQSDRAQTKDRRERPARNSPVQRPQPVPPYADLLLFSLLIVAVDTGLSFTKHWHLVEEDKVRLEKENIEAQLGILRHQISPHFFMNTLNNIYSLIESDKERSRQAVMRLSKLMRYLLYENQNGKVPLSKEFEFIKSYVDLMKLRFVDEVEISLKIPEVYNDIEIPVLLFISYLENAFKFGTSYENKSFIETSFIVDDDYIHFSCINSRNVFSDASHNGGIGLKNSRQRLDLLFGDRYHLNVQETEGIFSVELKIPIR